MPRNLPHDLRTITHHPRVLSLANGKLSPQSLADIFEHERGHGHIEKLDLRFNHLAPNASTLISEFIEQQVTLNTLNLGHNHLNDVGIRQISATLCHHPCIRSVDVSDNHLTIKGLESLLRVFQYNNTLQTLSLRDNLLERHAAEKISALLVQNPDLFHLDCRGNAFCPDGIKTIALGLSKNTKLKNLNLSHVEMDDVAAKCLFYAIKNHPTLTNLVLSLNYLSDACMPDLIDCLSQSNLTHVDLKQNTISDRYIGLLIDCIKQNHKIVRCDLRGNRISRENIDVIDSLLAENARKHQLIQRELHSVRSMRYKPIPEAHKQMRLLSAWIAFEKSDINPVDKQRLSQEVMKSLMLSFSKTENRPFNDDSDINFDLTLKDLSLVLTQQSVSKKDSDFFEKQFTCLLAISDFDDAFSNLLQMLPTACNFLAFTQHIHECAFYLYSTTESALHQELKQALLVALNFDVNQTKLVGMTVREKLNSVFYSFYQSGRFSFWHTKRLIARLNQHRSDNKWLKTLWFYLHAKEQQLISDLLLASSDEKRHHLLSKHFQSHKDCAVYLAFCDEFDVKANSFQVADVSHVKPNRE